MKAKQFAWTHVIKNGMMGKRPSYYGGWEYIDRHSLSYEGAKAANEKNKKDTTDFLVKIKTVGVDWNRTDDIQAETYSQFNGTFCDSSEETYLEGWMTLNDGTKAFWCSENINAADVFSQLANASKLIEQYKQIFEKD